jgi:signal transduction histidine kinase/CheY-like chemotaxis protein
LVLQDGKPHLSAIQAAPAIIFGLSLHYAFLRLPLWVSASIGWAVTLAAIVWVPAAVGESEFVRNVVYLVFANFFGMVLSQLVETRERELFFQRRRAEAAQAEARERQAAAEEADRQKTRLIAAVSHDLRQPMTAALAYLEAMRSGLVSNEIEAARLSAERAEASVRMLGSTLDHLLTAARYDSGTEALSIGFVELTPLLRDLYEAFVGEAERRSVRLRIRLPRERTVLTTDLRSAHRVLSNLVANAIKFSDPGRGNVSEVLVAARLRNGVCRIDVFDSGIGIASEQAVEIWKPFVQLNNIERDRERGLGLGLFLVKRIVEQLPGHSISMQSTLGRGSRFTLSMPASTLKSLPDAPANSASETPPIDPTTLSGAYVLLLEDDRDTRIAVGEMLEAWGVIVSAGATMTEMLGRHADSDRMVDAIICDYRLAGGTNGVDAIEQLRNRLGYAPHAVLITGEPDIAPIRARAGPETTVLHKPFPPDSLARPLLRAVQAARQLEEG